MRPASTKPAAELEVDVGVAHLEARLAPALAAVGDLPAQRLGLARGGLDALGVDVHAQAREGELHQLGGQIAEHVGAGAGALEHLLRLLAIAQGEERARREARHARAEHEEVGAVGVELEAAADHLAGGGRIEADRARCRRGAPRAAGSGAPGRGSRRPWRRSDRRREELAQLGIVAGLAGERGGGGLGAPDLSAAQVEGRRR
jgi:hypothetical protein